MVLTFSLFSEWKKEGGVSIISDTIKHHRHNIIPHLTAVNEVFESVAVEHVYNNGKFSTGGR